MTDFGAYWHQLTASFTFVSNWKNSVSFLKCGVQTCNVAVSGHAKFERQVFRHILVDEWPETSTVEMILDASVASIASYMIRQMQLQLLQNTVYMFRAFRVQ